MQFVAASKLKRAQDATLAARPYAEKLDEVLADLAAVLGGEDHPLLAQREGGKRLIVLVTTDRGLAGPLNTNTIRFAAQRDHRARPATSPSSPSAARAATRCAGPASRSRPTSTGFGDRPTFADVLPLARLITDDYLAGDVQPRRPRLQPASSRRSPSGRRSTSCCRSSRREDTEGIPGNQFIFEPSPGAVLEQLLPRYVATRLFQAVLESKASEESSRMVAMKNATENAEELIDDLTLAYNKVRQANITREMIEIATGAEAR